LTSNDNEDRDDEGGRSQEQQQAQGAQMRIHYRQEQIPASRQQMKRNQGGGYYGYGRDIDSAGGSDTDE